MVHLLCYRLSPLHLLGLGILKIVFARTIILQDDWQNLDQPEDLSEHRKGQESFKMEQNMFINVIVCWCVVAMGN